MLHVPPPLFTTTAFVFPQLVVILHLSSFHVAPSHFILHSLLFLLLAQVISKQEELYCVSFLHDPCTKPSSFSPHKVIHENIGDIVHPCLTTCPTLNQSRVLPLNTNTCLTYHLNKVEVEVVELEIICPKREMVTQ